MRRSSGTPSPAPSRKRLHTAAPESGALAGVVCSLRGYRLAWLLNRHLDWNLSRVAEVMPFAQDGKAEGNGFARFTGECPIDKSSFCLISNRFAGAYLMPEQKSFDYFLLVQGGWYEEHFALLLDRIRPLPNVLTVFHVQPPKVKQRLNVLLE